MISTFTSTGLATARKLYPQHTVVPLPFDLSFVVRRALERFDPRLVIIAESELWPNFIRLAHEHRRSGRDRERQDVGEVGARTRAPRIDRARARRRRPLRRADRGARRALLLARRAGGASSVTGNMKYDLTRAPEAAAQRAELRRALGYADGDVVIIGGSLHEREDEALLDAFAAARAANERAALIIVPRYPADAAAVEQHAAARGHRAILKSALDAGRASAPGRDGVLIVDTLGELGRLYAASDVAFVGGSLFYRAANKGGHNLMEPAILAVPVLFGPYNFSFKETVEDLLAANAGVMIRDARELAQRAQHARRRRRGAPRPRPARSARRASGAGRERAQLRAAARAAARGPRLQAPAFDSTMPRQLRTTGIPVATRGTRAPHDQEARPRRRHRLRLRSALLDRGPVRDRGRAADDAHGRAPQEDRRRISASR